MDIRHLNTKSDTIVVGGKYILQERLGGGSFGQLYAAIVRSSKISVAVKLEQSLFNKHATLAREAKVLSTLKNEMGFPTFYIYGKEESFNFLVMNKLGLNLERLKKLCGGKFSLKTVLMLADQMLTRIEALHKNSYLHRDIKPENFCIGIGDDSQSLFLIDFGLARSYLEFDGKHIPYKEKKGLVGTARYASMNTHLGIEQGRRDDLESIGYTLVYFLKGELPWQNIKVQDKQEKYRLISEAKSKISSDELCQGLPEEFVTYFNYVRGLEFTDAPDYKYLKRLFRTLFIKNHYTIDYNYDWLEVNEEDIKTKQKINHRITQVDSKAEIKQIQESIKLKLEAKKVSSDAEIPAKIKNPFFQSIRFLISRPSVNELPNITDKLNSSNKENPNKKDTVDDKPRLFKKTKTDNVIRDPVEKRSNKVLEVRCKNGASTSEGSSKAMRLSNQEEMDVATEFDLKDFVSSKMSLSKIMTIKTKDFGYETKRLFTSTCFNEDTMLKSHRILIEPKKCHSFRNDYRNELSRSDDIKMIGEALNENIEKTQVTQRREIAETEEDGEGTSICEWSQGNYLLNIMQQKSFVVNVKHF